MDTHTHAHTHQTQTDFETCRKVCNRYYINKESVCSPFSSSNTTDGPTQLSQYTEATGSSAEVPEEE